MKSSEKRELHSKYILVGRKKEVRKRLVFLSQSFINKICRFRHDFCSYERAENRVVKWYNAHVFDDHEQIHCV